jgi:hypothetical protein
LPAAAVGDVDSDVDVEVDDAGDENEAVPRMKIE